MKKYILFIIVLLLSITQVNAKEYCTVLSGTGKNVGDEITCGDEHFYVIDSNSTNIKMLSKYNLYVGIIVDQTGPTFNNYDEADEYCRNIPDVDVSEAWESINNQQTYYCHTEKVIHPDKVKQSSEAIGLTMKNGQFVTRQVGIVYIDHLNNDVSLDEHGNYLLSYGEIQGYLNDYKNYLISNGYEINKTELIKMNGFKNLMEKISSDDYSYLDNYQIQSLDDTPWELDNGPNYEVLHINLKDSIPKKYNWIYSTTYWFGSSLMLNSSTYNSTQYYDVFMTTLGDLCAWNRGCNVVGRFGAGVRPVVYIPNNDINYKITTKTDGHGTITSSRDVANGGEVITFRITPEKGYTLSKVTVTDGEGKVVTFTDYKFTMPSANVIIEAKFVPENPKTGYIVTPFIILLIGITSISIIYKKKKQIKD